MCIRDSIKRFHTMHRQLEQIAQDAERARQLAVQLDHSELESIALRIQDTAQKLLEE